MGVKQLDKKKLKVSSDDKELERIVEESRTKIKVVGAGGAGGNTITRLMENNIVGAETIAVNTDALDLLSTNADKKILIGRNVTRGLGAGANPQLGMEAAQESKEEIKDALEKTDMVFLTCGLGGGCLRGSSLILTNPHGPVRIDSIQPSMIVYTIDEVGRLQERKVLAAMKTGVKRVFEIKTKNRTLYASYDHPFLKVISLVTDKRGKFYKFRLKWEKAENLNIGDFVVILRKVPNKGVPYKLPDGNYTNEEFCRLFGFLLGDGWISKSFNNWICFSLSPVEEKNKRYLLLIKKIFGKEMKRGKNNWYYCHSKNIYYLLKELGLKKEIPSWIFGLPHSQKKSFIYGLADADGNYYLQKGKKKLELRFEMSSEKFIRQLKVLCETIGLRTSNVYVRERKINTPHLKKVKKFKSWGVRLYQLDENIKRRFGIKRKRKEFLYGYRGSISSQFFKYFGFARITSKKEVGEEEVYDITVEGSHNFVAEGFVVHNTGSGSLPVIAEIAKRLNALVVGVVTLPFSMEGKERMKNAREAIDKLEKLVDTLIVIPNDRLLEIAPDVDLITAFRICDEILMNAVKGIAELITKPGIINRDFADVKAIMSNGGLAMIGLGESNSENRAKDSVEKAINNPLLTVDINDAKGALIHIASGPGLKINEARQIVESISSKLSPNAKVLWGVTIDETLKDVVRTMLIVTGVESPQIFGPSINKRKKKYVEKALKIKFVE